MSGMNSILKEMAEAQQAVELVPQLRDEIRREREDNLKLAEDLSESRDDLRIAKEQIASMAATIARLEVERDDASFREMAAADQLASIQSNLGALIDLAQTLKPKAEPTAEAEQKPVESMPPQDGWKPYERLDQRIDETISQPQVESATDPTPDSSVSQTTSSFEPSESVTSSSDTIDPSLGFLKPSQPYAGVTAFNKPFGVSWDVFIAGGGEAPSWYVKPKAEEDEPSTTPYSHY